MSAIGKDFPRERFLCTPVSGIRDLLAFIDNEEARQINLHSSSVAMLSYQVASIAAGMGGQSPPSELTTESFLPFPKWKPADELFAPESVSLPKEPRQAAQPKNKLSTLLASLLKQQRIPVHVYLALRDLTK